MKNSILLFTIGFGFIVLNSSLYAQPQTAQWPFYLAFEDATGATDTLWYVFDESANSINIWTSSVPYNTGQDPQFGEIPLDINDSTFSVWMLGVVSFVDNDPGISDIVWGPFNVSAMPFLGGGFAGHIFADNFELPITLRWDSTLINNDVVLSAFSEGMNSSIMDNAYLFNYDESGAFCISLHPGELVLPPFDWFSQEHFPIYIEISNGNFCFSLSVEDFNLKDINVYPNPASTLIRVDMEGPIQSLQIMNLQGQTILTHSAEAMGALNEIDISSLPTGMYLLMVSNSKGQGMAKFVKD